MKIPSDRKFTKDHEWALPEGAAVKIGITEYAQQELGDVVFVDLPQVGQSVTQGQVFGTVESVKAVSELYAPVSGTVRAINTQLRDEPAAVNESPYDRGWMIVVDPVSPGELETLLSPESYQSLLGK